MPLAVFRLAALPIATCASLLPGTFPGLDSALREATAWLDAAPRSVDLEFLSRRDDRLANASGAHALLDAPTPTLPLVHTVTEPDELKALAISPDSSLLVTGDKNGKAVLRQLHNASKPTMWHTIADTEEAIQTIAFSPDGAWLACGGGMDTTLRLYTLSADAPPSLEHTLDDEGQCIYGVAFSADGKLLATGNEHMRVYSLTGKAPKLLYILDEAEQGLHSVAFSADGRWLASGSFDKRTRVYSVKDGQKPRLERMLDDARGFILSVAFSGDSKYLASASTDYRARLYDTQTWRLLTMDDATATSYANAVAFSMDSGLLAVGSQDFNVRVYSLGEPSAPSLKYTMETTGPVMSLSFSEDTKYLAVGSVLAVFMYALPHPATTTDAPTATTTYAPPDAWKMHTPAILGIAAGCALALVAATIPICCRKRSIGASLSRSDTGASLALSLRLMRSRSGRSGFRANDDGQDAIDTAYRPLPRLGDDWTGEAEEVTLCLRRTMEIPQFASGVAKNVGVLIAEGWKICDNRIANGLLQRHPRLTKDSVFAVAVFTLELRYILAGPMTLEDEFYCQFSRLFRFRRAADMECMAGFVHHFLVGLKAMPKHRGTLWRGIAGEFAGDVTKQYTRHSVLCWNAPSSATPDRQMARSFAGKSGILLKITDVENCAYDIREISAFGYAEDERTIYPGSKFVVVREAHKAADGTIEIHVAEVPAEHKH